MDKEQIIQNIVKLGENIVYFPEIHKCYTFSMFNPSNSNHGIDFHELKGKDITIYIDNFDSNMQDIYTFKTKLESLTPVHIKLHKNYLWIMYWSI